MSDKDMIRRGDAIAVCRHAADAERAADHIETIPAVTPKVRPLKFEQVYAEFHAAETPFGTYEVWGDYWRSPFSKKTEQSADPIAAAQADFDDRTIAALDLTPAPDAPVEIDMRAVMMERIEEAASQSPWVPAEYSMSEVVSDCCAFLREPRQPATDAAAIREAALREAADECNRHADWIEESWRQGLYSAEGCLRTSARNILALLPKGGA